MRKEVKALCLQEEINEQMIHGIFKVSKFQEIPYKAKLISSIVLSVDLESDDSGKESKKIQVIAFGRIARGLNGTLTQDEPITILGLPSSAFEIISHMDFFIATEVQTTEGIYTTKGIFEKTDEGLCEYNTYISGLHP